jgi:hypothetical protein
MIVHVTHQHERTVVSKFSYEIGLLTSKHLLKIIVFLALPAAFFAYVLWQPNVSPSIAIAIAAPKVIPAPVWDEKKALAEKCDKTIPDLMEKATAAYAEKDYDLAVDTLWICQGYMSDPKVKEFYTRALTKRNKIKSDETDKQVKADKARKKKEGVIIGMTEQDVLESSWGRPVSVNTTSTAYRTRAQWVYKSGNYLYFEDGKLTSIQH